MKYLGWKNTFEIDDNLFSLELWLTFAEDRKLSQEETESLKSASQTNAFKIAQQNFDVQNGGRELNNWISIWMKSIRLKNSWDNSFTHLGFFHSVYITIVRIRNH